MKISEVKFDKLMKDTCANSLLEELDDLPKRAKELLLGLSLSDVDDFRYVFDELVCGNFGRIICDSPIETIFYIAYMCQIIEMGFPYTELLILYRQTEIIAEDKRYRVDFLIDTESVSGIKKNKPVKLVIECDGHDFHEKTKEQVERRNKRDFELKKVGYDVLHFSGSQIYKDPIDCAKKVIDYCMAFVGEATIDHGSI